MTESVLSQAAKMESFTDGAKFATKCAAVKFAKPAMSCHLSSKWRGLGCVGSAMRPECARKDRVTSSAGYIPTEKAAQRSSKDRVTLLHLRFCLVHL